MPLYTERLTIRALQESDWCNFQQIAADFAASPYRYYDHTFPLDDASVQRITARLAASGLFFAVCLKNEMIGYVCFHETDGVYDLGFSFRTAFHGKGYAYEACTALLTYYEAQGITRFSAGTALDNTPSVRLLERLGFRPIDTEKLEFHQGHPFIGGRFERRL